MALQIEERTMLENSVARFVEENGFREKDDQSPTDLWQTFANLGWLSLPVGEQSGGLGGDVMDLQVLSREFGRGLITSPFIDSAVTIASILHEVEAGAELLSQVMSGDLLVVLAHGENQFELGYDHVESSLEVDGGELRLCGTKNCIPFVQEADYFIVSVITEGQHALVLLDKDTAGLKVSSFPAIDGRTMGDLYFDSAQLSEDAILIRGPGTEELLKRAQLIAICCAVAEMEGIAEAARTLTAEYLTTREQFGQTLAEFQALQHIFADIVIAEEELQSISWMCANATIDEPQEFERTVRAAKARAGAIARPLLEQSVQLHGGVGASEEYAIGQYLRRTLALDAMLGDANLHTRWQVKGLMEQCA